MIYITGDMHGDFDRFKAPSMKKLGKGDTLIVCGDFGFIWDGSRDEKLILDKLAEKSFTIAFIDGCHENFDLLEDFEPIEWNGGLVRKIRPNVINLMRGQIYDIENKRIFTFGGGHSQDFDFRRDSRNWWEREQPTHDEILEAIDTLSNCNNSVDFIITHEPPASLKDCLGVDVFQRLEVHTFFEDIIKACRFKRWYFGKCHIDKHIPVKFYAVFDRLHTLK